MKYNLNISALLIFCLSCSCVTHRKLTYLQYTGSPADTTISAQIAEYKIQPYDNLFIRVVTPDPKWSEMFNTMQVSASGTTISEQSADMISYSVDGEGNIELPYTGKFQVARKTIGVIKTEIGNGLRAYVTDAAVTVKMINNYVSVLGEVRQPGRFQIYKEKLNIFQAIAMAGDLGEYGNRQRVQVIRQVEGKPVVSEFSLTDRKILFSEFYYVMPNDVIYVMPLKGRFFQMNSFPYTLIISTITTFILFLNILK